MPALKERRIRHGERVVAASGKLDGASLSGVPLQVVRDEEHVFNSESGREEGMVGARAVLDGSRLGALVHIPTRRLVGHGASRVGFTRLYGAMYDRIFGKK
jgi:hypothetical protein